MSQLIFYTNPMSRGQIVRWALQEVGVEYEQVLVNYGADMKSDEYRTINPMGKVPAIKHDSHVVTECAAICTYLADMFPDAKLAPDTRARADYYRWLFFAAGPLEAAIINKNLGFDVKQDQQVMAGYGNYDLVVDVLDQFLTSREYVCGEQFTMADVYLGAQVDWGVMFKTLPEKASFVAYAERLRAREAYQQAKRIDAELTPKES
ncbi:glutathione S-transferase [Arenicella chitinivorans]|uniref:Glutathione S-transferase n=1 Tax=Arenicella chitinivorans TaxID=1329800 RepID=A0A918RPL3_9GAMM|nr:glutathione S-transferase family protein [Arenicella chitinivorans]GHA04344.1 glutathione S-transferase [Arenicella chitinivorans]